jgi:hypothetical protein
MIDRTPPTTVRSALLPEQFALVEQHDVVFQQAVQSMVPQFLAQTERHFPSFSAREVALFAAAIGTTCGDVLLAMAADR